MPGFSKTSPCIRSSHSNPRAVFLPPILKKRQLRFREITCLPKVIKPPSGQARCELRSVGFRACGHPQISLAVRIPQATISWLFCLKKLRTSHADNYLLLSTWTSCPFIGKGNDFWLHPVSPQPPALPTETEKPIHHWGLAHPPPLTAVLAQTPRFCQEQRQLCSRSFPPPQLPSSPCHAEPPFLYGSPSLFC